MCNLDNGFFEKAEQLRQSLPSETDPDTRDIMRKAINRYYEADCSLSCSKLAQKADVILNFSQENNHLEITRNLTMSEYNIGSNNRNSNIGNISHINIGSWLANVSQNINDASKLGNDKKQQFESLFVELTRCLEPYKESHEEQIKSILHYAKGLTDEIAKREPKKTLLQMGLQGLKTAAECAEDITSKIISVITQISDFVKTCFLSDEITTLGLT